MRERRTSVRLHGSQKEVEVHRGFQWAFTGMLAGALIGSAAAADDYPNRPIRLIIPFPPGGSNDIIDRMLGLQLDERMGKPVVIDNRAGAGGNLGIDIAAKSAPDGYTMLMVSAAFAFGPSMY